ncbi:TlpA family protein disulfide reductase [Chryseobacterium oryctis]|uniref:TlpA family protein disulfide reductase n=1 Tax=Chryseobacterium oryctis TaxID=2952618 RepID=A0ABT3HR49_9FLAO|nr:TlpA disulfide reductase family protein [Chryseobacterium oryctis]MCW3162266.1 TlpA family protein disulfide reductase [Chryseobacterium oryctis]
MKKIILSTLVLLALSSCKKEEPKNDNETGIDSTSVTENTDVVNNTFISPEIAPEKIGDYLAKNNDTLYVTNFFATWCGPCMREIPHFKNKMQELKGKPVKFTFVSLDERTVWNDDVKNFAEEHDLAKNIVLLDGQKLDANFFPKNFQKWDGGSIPFTFFRKGAKTEEFLGMMTEDELNNKINTLLK